MRLKFKTLDNKIYSVNPQDYKIKWAGKSASKFEFEGKRYFFYLFKNHFVCEEFPVKPYIGTNLRCDLINLDMKLAIELNGCQHLKFNSHFFKTEEDWWASIERDSLKKKTLELNGYSLVEIYPHNTPITLSWLKKTYPNIRWPFKHPKE